MVRVMFDTNVFNHLLDGEISAEDIDAEWQPVITHIQRDELDKTRDSSRRHALEAKVLEVAAQKVATESAVWGASRWGEAKWPGPASRYTEVHAALEGIKRKPNNVQDALIADTCLQNGYILVTNDGALKSVVESLGGAVIDLRK